MIETARQAGATIIHSPIQFAPGYREITSHPYGILKGVVDSSAFVKRGLDAFGSTNLDFILGSKGIETVALGGFLTNCCGESTMRSAYERGYEVVILTDCVAATSAEADTNAITYDYPMFSKPMTSGSSHTPCARAAPRTTPRGDTDPPVQRSGRMALPDRRATASGTPWIAGRQQMVAPESRSYGEGQSRAAVTLSLSCVTQASQSGGLVDV